MCLFECLLVLVCLWFRLNVSLCVCDHVIVSIVKSSVCYFLFYCVAQSSFLSVFICCQDHSRCYHDNHKTRVCDFSSQTCMTFESSCETRSLTFSCPLTHLQTSAAERVSEHMGHCTTPQSAHQTTLTEERKSSSCFHH